MIEKIVLSYLNTYLYNNVNLFVEGCKDEVSQRQVTPLEINIPGYCYQHNEIVYKQLVAVGLNSVCERVTRKAAIVVKQFEEDIKNSYLLLQPISHNALMLDNKYIIDVGFSDNSLRGLLPFK